MMRSKVGSCLMTMALLALCTTTVRAQQTQQTGAQPGATVLTAASPDPQAGTDQDPYFRSASAGSQLWGRFS
jgi:hypothetical protein